MEFLNIFTALLLIPITLLVSFLCLQIILGIIFFNKFSQPLTGKRGSVTILIPAHNESAVIEKTLESLIPHLKNQDKVIVIADNCQDNTAQLAKKFNVEVLERNNNKQKGKGYALSYGIQYLKNTPPETLIILDADCIVEDFAIDQLAIAANLFGTPIQASYLMKRPVQGKSNSNLNMFAFFLKNRLRPIGLKALNLPCQLMGSGMAFSWNLIEKVDFATADLVEDIKLGIDFTLQGSPPTFLSSAKIYSFFPDDHSTKKIQSTRWEHGHLTAIKNLVPKLLKKLLVSKNYKLCLCALDLSIPPLSLLIILFLFHLIVIFFLSAFLLNSLFIVILICIGLLLIFSILVAWFTRGQHLVSSIDVLKIPFYVLKKLSIYISFFKTRQIEWIKTQRKK